MSAFIKDILREIRHSLGRFISIMMIVAIGTAFFAGVKASIPDMKKSADSYFDDYNLMDIRLLSTMGFSKEDVKAISKVKDIEGMDANYAYDFVAHKDTRELVVKAIGWENKKEKDPNYINKPVLVEGRFPEKENECMIEAGKIRPSGYQIGDTITLETGTKDNINDYLKQDTFTIVGMCYTPDYLSFEKGSSNIGSGKVDTFIIFPKSNYVMDYYTEVLIRVKGAKDVNTYSDAYFDITDKVTMALNSVGDNRAEIRYEEIQKIANDTWQKHYDEYEKGKVEAEEKLKEAEKQLDDAKSELLLGEAKLASSQANFETLMITSEAQITQSEAMLDMYETQLKELLTLQEELNNEYDDVLETLNQTVSEEEKRIAELNEKLNDESLSDTEKDLIRIEIAQREAILKETKARIDKMNLAIQTVNDKILYYENMIVSAKEEIKIQKQKLADGKIEAEKQFALARKQLDDGQTQYINGKIAFEKNKKLAEEELEIGKEKLEAAKEQLNNLPEPTWYVLDRNSHFSYRDYKSVTERMEGIASIFPAFFLLVAALVCLTTMTRMVDEQRGVIGTYKALGYSKVAIAMKYIMYAFIASVAGCVLGCVLGMYIFPYIIYNAWNLMYTLPPITFEMQPMLAFTSSLSICVVTLLASIVACYKELIDVPALLMRPKAPKVGKTILLEKIPFIWNRFSFTMKVTARNIFRYKKRFFMTVIGISGCTALLLAGFGIRDSISSIVDIQYKEIMQYDAQMNFAPNASLSEKEDILDELKKDKNVKDYLALSSVNTTVELEDSTQSVSVIVPDDSEAFEKYISMRERKGHNPLRFETEGAIVSEKLTMNLGLDVGDKIKVKFDDGIEREVKISGIMENYVGHVIYMTPSYYKQLCGYRSVDNTVLIKMKDANAKSEKALGNAFISKDNVASMVFYRSAADSFDETINSLNIVVIALITSAGLLAFVVLYNLTNVNISERLREIATIKVLGFYDKEVSSYVYRENIFLTIIGAFAGLALGVGLHALIMNMAEMPEIMFGRNINFISFVYAVCITMIFSILVNLVMYRKLQRIPMVESLKSVE